jgi:hypothetical protein
MVFLTEFVLHLLEKKKKIILPAYLKEKCNTHTHTHTHTNTHTLMTHSFPVFQNKYNEHIHEMTNVWSYLEKKYMQFI